MGHEAIAQLSALLSQAEGLRESLSNGERMQLMGLAGAFIGELQRPDEALFRMTFNDVSTLSEADRSPLRIAFRRHL